MSKRGISPVISIVLIAVIVVVLGTGIFMWTSGLSEEVTESTLDQKAKLEIIGKAGIKILSHELVSNNQIKFKIENVGSVPISGMLAHFSGGGGTALSNSTEPLESFEIKDYTFDYGDAGPLETAEITPIIFYDSDGNVFVPLAGFNPSSPFVPGSSSSSGGGGGGGGLPGSSTDIDIYTTPCTSGSDCDVDEVCDTSLGYCVVVECNTNIDCETDDICISPGTVSAHCGCLDGSTKECGYSDVGICEYGTQTCAGENWDPECKNAVYPLITKAEPCDGLDNDCDGETDEGCPGCTDDKDCTSPLICIDGFCVSPVCGDGNCVKGETPESCPKDCSWCETTPNDADCTSFMPRYYYDSSRDECISFTEGGCDKDGVALPFFNTMENCMEDCQGASSTTDWCAEEWYDGSCSSFLPRYHYDSKTKACVGSTIGGCDRDGNPLMFFSSQKDCEDVCIIE